MSDNPCSSLSVRTIKDTGKLFGAQLVVGVFAVFFSAWLNRLLSTKELALWPICVGLGGLIASFSSAGMGDTFVRLVPALFAQGKDEEARGILRVGIVINCTLAVVIGGLLYVFAEPTARLLLHDEASVPLVRSMLFAAVFIGLRDRLAWALRATQQFGKQALITILVDTGRTPLAIALFFALGQKVEGVIWALTIIPAVACALTLFWLRKYLRGPGRCSPIKLVRFSLPFYGASILAFASDRMNYLLIGSLASPEALSAYFVADSIAGYVQALGAFASGALGPKLSEKLGQDMSSATRIFTKCTRYSFLGLLPIHVIVAVLAAPLMRLYGGTQYAQYGYVLMLLCFGAFLEAIFGLQYTYVQILGSPWRLFVLTGARGLAAIATLVVLLPPYAAVGAALARIVAAIFLIILSAYELRSAIRVRYDLSALVMSAIASAIAAAVAATALLPQWHHGVAVAVGTSLGSVAYVVCLARRLETSDVDLLVQMLPQRIVPARMRDRLRECLGVFLAKPAVDA